MDRIREFLELQLHYKPGEVEIVTASAGGATNRSAIFLYQGKKYVLRFGTHHAAQLRINRKAEYASLMAIGDLTGKVIYFDVNTGDMVMEYIEGVLLSGEELQKGEWIDRVTKLLKEMHSKKIEYEFDPFVDIEERFSSCRLNGVKMPDHFDSIMQQCDIIKERLVRTRSMFYGLCHNDPFAGNFIWSHEEKLKLIDFEYAGNGDIFFDLACLAWGYTPELRKYLLQSYFQECTEELYERLRDNVFVVALWNASWAMVKRDDKDTGFDYDSGVTHIFDLLSGWNDTLF